MTYDILKNGNKVLTCTGLGWAWNKLGLTPQLPARKTGKFYIPYFKERGYEVVVVKTQASADLGGLELKMEEMIQEAMKKFAPVSKELVIKQEGKPTVKLTGLVHARQEDLIKIISATNAFGKRLIPYLHGPAGSGKTEGSAKAAEALGLEFYAQSFHPFSEPGDIFGYVDAMGEVVNTPFREAYTNGGVYLADEMDSASGRILTAFNMALSQSTLLFPSGKGKKPKMVAKHKDFIFIAAGNTTLTGGNRTYSGRQELDGATIQRFVFLEWNYDLRFEKAMSSDEKWLQICWAVRKNIAVQDLQKFVVSVRNIVDGEALLKSGFSYKEAFEMRIAQGASDDIKKLLLTGINL